MCYIYHNFAGGSPAFFFFGQERKKLSATGEQEPTNIDRKISKIFQKTIDK